MAAQGKKQLTRELDKRVSHIVRHMETKCFTCGKHLPLKARQAGHYIPREVKFLRWDFDNVHVQCAKCNVAMGGNLKQYSERLPSGVRHRLDFLYDAYKHGNLPEPTLEQMQRLATVLAELDKW